MTDETIEKVENADEGTVDLQIYLTARLRRKKTS